MKNRSCKYTLDQSPFYQLSSKKKLGNLLYISHFKGHLPTGSPLSPIMSYYSHIDMWGEVNTIVRDAQCTLTVYMDDLTVSGMSIPTRTIWQIKQRIYRCGLKYHKEKRYTGKIRKVTGLIINNCKLKSPNKQHLKIKELNRQIKEKLNPEKRNKLLLRMSGLKAQVIQIKRSNNHRII